MLATFAALVLSTSPAVEVRHFTAQAVLAKKKKKPPKGDKTSEKEKEKDKPPDTNEGLDLSGSSPPPTAETTTQGGAEPTTDPDVAKEAAPEAATAGGFSVVTPHTVGEGGNLVEAAVGWPGVYAGYWRGILSALDVGARVGFNWAYEGQFTKVTPGLRIQAQARYLFYDNGFLSVGVTFAPGLLVYFLPGSGAHAGVIIPITGVAGFKIMEKLNACAMVEIPFWALGGFGAVLPIMVGGGAEYFLTDAIAIQAKVKAGPSVWFNGAGVFFTLEGVAGVAWHL
jgi:hypothetical protein